MASAMGASVWASPTVPEVATRMNVRCGNGIMQPADKKDSASRMAILNVKNRSRVRDGIDWLFLIMQRRDVARGHDRGGATVWWPLRRR